VKKEEGGRTSEEGAGARSIDGGFRESTFILETSAGGEVVVAGSRVGAPESAGPQVARFTFEAVELRPALINGHDHLALNHFPRLGAPPYPNLYAWAEEVQERYTDEVSRGREFPRHHALLFGALKNLLGGAARVAHHGAWDAAFAVDFPVAVEPTRILHSLGLEPDLDEVPGPPGIHEGAGPGRPLAMHLAEGVDERARGEVEEAARRGLLGPNLLAVHLVGVDEAGSELLRRSGAAFVWCPSSNLHLYGRTAPECLFRGGIDVILGSDSLLSGEGTLLDEIRVARDTGLLDDEGLEASVTSVPALRLGRDPPSLDPGAPAHLLLLRRPLLEARPVDVVLVLVAGRPRYGDPATAELFRLTGVEAETLEVGGEEKLVMAPLGRVARRVVERVPQCGRIFR